MKKLAAGILAISMSASTYAVSPGGDDCGWGNLLFEGQSGLPIHLLATFVNATSGNKTFGMTSGTNGCDTGGRLSYGGDSLLSMGDVMDEFSEDVARGDGETLSAVAIALGIEAQDREHFKHVMHSNFDALFPSESVTAQEVDSTIRQLILQDKVLEKYAS